MGTLFDCGARFFLAVAKVTMMVILAWYGSQWEGGEVVIDAVARARNLRHFPVMMNTTVLCL